MVSSKSIDSLLLFVRSAAILILASMRVAAAAGADRFVDREWESCVLVEGEAGSVWLQDLYLLLPGGWHQDDVAFQGPPRARLASALARDLAPLAARIEERTRAKPLPRARDGKSPVFILHVAGRERWTQARGRRAMAGKKGTRSAGAPGDGGYAPSSEIVAARIIHAEILTPAWVAAWENLAACLQEIAQESLGPPGE